MIYFVAWLASHVGLVEMLVGILATWLFSAVVRDVIFDLIQASSAWENSKLDLVERRMKLQIAEQDALLNIQTKRKLLRGGDA